MDYNLQLEINSGCGISEHVFKEFNKATAMEDLIRVILVFLCENLWCFGVLNFGPEWLKIKKKTTNNSA